MTLDVIVSKPTKKSEFEECFKVTQKAWTGLPCEQRIPEHIMQASDRTSLFRIAKENSRVVGYAMCFNAKENQIYLHAIGVDGKAHSKGIGKKLMDELCKDAREKGVESILLTYEPFKTNNANLYIRKMKGQVIGFELDAYQSTNDNGDASTDRFLVKISTAQEDTPVREIPTNALIQTKVCKVKYSPAGNMEIIRSGGATFDHKGFCAIEVPSSIKHIENHGQEKEFGLIYRDVFTLARQVGEIVDFRTVSEFNQRRNFYILQQRK